MYSCPAHPASLREGRKRFRSAPQNNRKKKRESKTKPNTKHNTTQHNEKLNQTKLTSTLPKLNYANNMKSNNKTKTNKIITNSSKKKNNTKVGSAHPAAPCANTDDVPAPPAVVLFCGLRKYNTQASQRSISSSILQCLSKVHTKRTKKKPSVSFSFSMLRDVCYDRRKNFLAFFFRFQDDGGSSTPSKVGNSLLLLEVMPI